MAGDWIKMRGNLWDDPRVAGLVDMTESSEAAVVGGLYWLWATADQHTEDGVMPGLTIKAIDRKTGLTGFGEALCSIGWIADHPEGIRICKFEEHNGASAKSRIQTAKRVATHKANAMVTVEALPKQKEVVTDALPREEKSREENKEGIAQATPATPTRKSKLKKTGLPEPFGVSNRVKAWGLEKGFDRLDEHMEAFKRKATARAYEYADWDDAFMEAVREDWAKLRRPGVQKVAKTDWSAKPDWVDKAGFSDVADANASRCFSHNAEQFRNGKRIEVTT